MTLPENDPAMQFACVYRGAKIVLQPQPVANVTPQSGWLTLHHGTPKLGDCHRFSMSEDPDDAASLLTMKLTDSLDRHAPLKVFQIRKIMLHGYIKTPKI